jgi:2-polyprenyl-6-methoxyphenol hydroxylase-like FAD-dependent oxidoreductase
MTQTAPGVDSDGGAAADRPGTAYAVPATELQRLQCHGRAAVVIGAGPAGLMAALTIRQEGYDSVIVLEKRSHFTRMNVVNLHPESLCVFMRLGLLDRFLETASRLVDHKNYVFVDGEALFNFSDHGFEAAVDPDARFDADDVLGGFTNETLYSINLADLQLLLATAALERGIQILAPVAGSTRTERIRWRS